MRISIFASSIVFASLIAGTAHAADPMAAAPVASAYNWTGGYLGLQAGYAWGDSTADYFRQSGSAATQIDPKGWLGGFYLGYNHQFSNNVVIGVDADAAYADIDGKGYYTFGGIVSPTETDSARLKWSAAVRGRLGYSIDRFMPYLAGGLAFGKIKARADGLSASFNGEWSKVYTGYTIGAGAEYALTDALILRGEYRFTDFGKETFTALNPGSEHSVDLKTHDIRVGFAYKF